MTDDYEDLTIASPRHFDYKCAPGFMVESVFNWRDQGDDFAIIQDKLADQISHTSAFIMVDDLDHLVKGGRFQMEDCDFRAICLALNRFFILMTKV